ncbi:MAG TPA: ribbon-helix-helix protein, CopG family [Smithellaceae bacterium]|jgi:metal-responsive CopG/Arc/MetJ family transcriptional regulator|nr:CopG family transcriptional regulator [Syntrophaceae bacterium]NMC90170.1 CopG family transcriptional regulator [Smithella sp.]HNV56522.1 ribbon-helix-helix protein, CopG family [Smithellaceae bacterium]MBP8667154.1 CopG family transcriptional regulator [Syntrophaceae bacterium]MBP9650247.1 CopG family transcriptional regulator [Syntrophaceae bacterium]
MMRSVLSVSLPEKMASELDAIARATGRNKSDIVKESLGVFLWEARFRRMKKTLGPKAKASGLITDDDVFKVIS